MFVFALLASVLVPTAQASAPAVAAVSSQSVEVHRPELRPAADGWHLAGCLAPRPGATPRLATHLDVVFLDATGAELAVRTEPLARRELRERPRRPRPHARYELTLGDLPTGTCRIEVRAHHQTESQH